MPRSKTVVGSPKLGQRDFHIVEKAMRTPDSEMDYTDNPPSPMVGWVRSKDFWAARKKNPSQFVVRLDPDVTAWLESLGSRGPSRVNAILRAAMKAAAKAGK